MKRERRKHAILRKCYRKLYIFSLRTIYKYIYLIKGPQITFTEQVLKRMAVYMNSNNIFQRKKHSWTLKASPCITSLKYEDVNSFYPSGETPHSREGSPLCQCRHSPLRARLSFPLCASLQSTSKWTSAPPIRWLNYYLQVLIHLSPC